MSKIPDQELLDRAKAKGYQRGAQKEKDEVRNRHKHVDKVKKNQNWTLDPLLAVREDSIINYHT
jgi:hypothetical protein